MELYLVCGEGLTLVVELPKKMSIGDFLARINEIKSLIRHKETTNDPINTTSLTSNDTDSERLIHKYHLLRKEHEKRVRTNHLPIDKRIDQLELQNAHILSLIDLIADGEHLKH